MRLCGVFERSDGLAFEPPADCSWHCSWSRQDDRAGRLVGRERVVDWEAQIRILVQAAHSFCEAGTFVLSGQTPPGCGQENGPLAFGYVLLVLGIIYAIAAIVRLAARGRSEVPPYRPSAL